MFSQAAFIYGWAVVRNRLNRHLLQPAIYGSWGGSGLQFILDLSKFSSSNLWFAFQVCRWCRHYPYQWASKSLAPPLASAGCHWSYALRACRAMKMLICFNIVFKLYTATPMETGYDVCKFVALCARKSLYYFGWICEMFVFSLNE